MLRLTVIAVCVMSGGFTAVSGAEPDLNLTGSCPNPARERQDVNCRCIDSNGHHNVTWYPDLRESPITVLQLNRVNRSRENETFTCSVFGAKPGGASITFTLRFPPLTTRRPAPTTTATAAATATVIPGTDASTPNPIAISNSTTSLHEVADSRDDGPSVAIVAGGVAGVVALIIIIIVVVVVFVKKKRGKSQYGAAERPTSETSRNDDFEEHINILYESADTARPAPQRLPTSGSAPVPVSTNHSEGPTAGLPWNVQPRGDADPAYSYVAVPTSGTPEDHVSTNHGDGTTARDLNGASPAQPRVNSDPGYERVGDVAVATPSALQPPPNPATE